MTTNITRTRPLDRLWKTRWLPAALAGAAALALAQSPLHAAIIFDDFNTSVGHFNLQPTFSATTIGVTTSPVPSRQTTPTPLEGSGFNRVTLNLTNAASVRVRLLSGSGTPANNTSFAVTAGTDGYIGFYLRTTVAGSWVTSIALDVPGNVAGDMRGSGDIAIIADGQWHLYEWNLDAATWGTVPGIVTTANAALANGNWTIDSIFIRNTSAGALSGANLFELDFVAKSDNGSVADLLAPPGADRIWNGGGGDNNWSTGANWVGGTAPALSGEGVIFDGTTRLNPLLNDDYNVSKLVFNVGAGAFTLGADVGRTLTLSGDVTQNSATAQTLDLPIFLSSPRGFNTFAGNLTLNGVVSGGGGISKLGTHTLTLTAPNTQSGVTTVAAGTLTVNSGAALSDTAVPLTVTGGTLNLNHAAQTIGSLTGTGTGTVNLGAGHTLTVNQTASATFAGTVAGTGDFIKEGPSILTITNFTVTGDVTVNTGQLRVGNARVFNQTAIPVAGGAQFGLFNPAGLTIVNSRLTGGGKVNRSIGAGAAGNAVFTHPDSDIAAFDVRAGIAFFSVDSTDLPVSKGPAGIGVITLGDDAGALGLGATNGTRVIGNDVWFEQSNVSATNLTIRGVNTLHLAGWLILNPQSANRSRLIVENVTTPTILAGVVTGGAAGLEKAGNGVLILGNDNTYNGDTVINAGTLLVTNTTGSGTSFGNVTVNSGGTLGGNGSIMGNVIVNAGGGIGAGASAGTLTLANGLDLSAGGTNVWELTANSTNDAGANFDQIALTGGNLALGGSSRLLLKFINSATFPDATNAFWQQTNSWTIIAGSGGAANAGPSNFSAIAGTNGCTAGVFSTAADADGNVVLTFTPSAVVVPPPPVINPLVGAGTTSAQISWSSVAGASYKVQYKTNLNQTGWLTLSNLTATGTSTTILDNTSPAPKERYYRVISP